MIRLDLSCFLRFRFDFENIITIRHYSNSEMNHLNPICFDWSNDILTIRLCKNIGMYLILCIVWHLSPPNLRITELNNNFKKCLTFQGSYVQNDIGRLLESWDPGRSLADILYLYLARFFYEKKTLWCHLSQIRRYDSATEIPKTNFYSANS